MKDSGRLLWLGVGLMLGITAALWLRPNEIRPALAGNDRAEDYIISTGPVTVNVNVLADGVWILDYRAGKLLGTIVDRNLGKLLNWAEVDLVQEFNIPPKQNVHFLMTTGTPIAGQTALYLAEINSGRFGVYTMAPRPDNRGMMIRRHDAAQFRAPAPPPQDP
ncbi:MAG: hypothetical protein EXS16_01440 [Gemmataceae bacterium]|nr:hypothetical protein [Gemmataceae bacterium]